MISTFGRLNWCWRLKIGGLLGTLVTKPAKSATNISKLSPIPAAVTNIDGDCLVTQLFVLKSVLRSILSKGLYVPSAICCSSCAIFLAASWSASSRSDEVIFSNSSNRPKNIFATFSKIIIFSSSVKSAATIDDDFNLIALSKKYLRRMSHTVWLICLTQQYLCDSPFYSPSFSNKQIEGHHEPELVELLPNDNWLQYKVHSYLVQIVRLHRCWRCIDDKLGVLVTSYAA